MVSLVTGASGFIGSHLARHLASLGHDVAAISRESTDILDAAAVAKLVAERKPEWIFHLAALSLPSVSWEQPARTFDVNVCGTINLFEAVRASGLNPVVVVFCSSSEYAVKATPISEGDPMGPISPYAISKLAQDHLVRLYAERYNLRVVRVRPFFITGPGKVGDVCSDLARRIVALENVNDPAKRGAVTIGNAAVVRDFLDVRDALDAFVLLAERGQAGEVYNVASGKACSIGDLVERFRAVSYVHFETRVDPALLRPIDEMVKVGDATKLRALGWSPRRGLDDMLRDILDFWRAQPAATS